MMTGGPAVSRTEVEPATSGSRLAHDEGSAAAFAGLVAEVKRAVEAKLEAILAGAVEAVRPCGNDATQAILALHSLCMRGGKRFRPVLVAAAHEACGGDAASEAVVLAGAAIELLQTYLLIHDDWMDDDDVRRGGPSVHAMLRKTAKTPHEGDAAAILAGDYASALAQEAIFSIALAGDRVVEAGRMFARVQREVIAGQLLDMAGAPPGGVESMHDLKTGSYTVRGPLAIGAILAGASLEQRASLDRFASPLGVAFQLRDDLLGTFGDPKATGKPAGNDLRRGKRTALVEAADADREARSLMERVFGNAAAREDDVAALMARLEASGARAQVEARLSALLATAGRELDSAPLSVRGKSWLRGAITALGERSH
jgi:geranylgeranyl diphosphate synthase type I